jgi:hypothetical protein
MRDLALVAVMLLAGCDYDDGPDPGDPGALVDFIRFSEPGMFREVFLDIVFQAGELAVDVLPGELTVRVPRLGPGSSTMLPIDNDLAPYPHFALPVKRTKHNGIWDKRFWVQFAGGSWNTLSIEGGPEDRFRASSSPPSFFPKTEYFWCPTGRACQDWLTAVHSRAVRCFTYTLNGFERPVNPWDCYFYHPRMHWHVIGCGNCPVPASSEALQVFEYPDQ